MGKIAAKLLLDQINEFGNYEQEGVLLPTNFTERKSRKNIKNEGGYETQNYFTFISIPDILFNKK